MLRHFNKLRKATLRKASLRKASRFKHSPDRSKRLTPSGGQLLTNSNDFQEALARTTEVRSGWIRSARIGRLQCG